MAANVDQKITAENSSWTFDSIAESFDAHSDQGLNL
jgi:hypothetical protein